MLNTNIKDAPNFSKISVSSMKTYYLKITYKLFSKKFCGNAPEFIFCIYYHQAIDLIESEIYNRLPPKSKRKPPQNVCVYFLKIKV